MSILDIGARDAALRFPKISRRMPGGTLSRIVETFPADESAPIWHSDWAWLNYERLALALAFQLGHGRMLEIGGGRDPTFANLTPMVGLDLVVNDIDAGELALLPPDARTACFDIAGDLGGRQELLGAFELVTSRMVFEHVADVEAAWRNTHALLKPGGVAIAFFPTLYGWPFVLNRLLPDALARKIVERVFPDRAPDGLTPVFPAHYDWCFGSEAKLRKMLDPIGFSEICVLPFWGHHYLDRLPGIRTLEKGMNRLFAAFDWRLFTTYTYVIVRK